VALNGHYSGAENTRELFKCSKDFQASLGVYNENTFFDFGFRIFCE